MIHITRFDLDMPDDFPVGAFEDLHASVSDRDPKANEHPAWEEWGSAVNGILYRFRACDEHGKAAIASLRESVSPPQPERYNQERWLFEFFFEGLSCIECFFFGLYFLANMADPSAFDLGIDRRVLTPKGVTDAYNNRFDTEPLTRLLRETVGGTELRDWAEIRNLLGHRGAPGRAFYEGGSRSSEADWKLPSSRLDLGSLLLPTKLEARRAWLGSLVTEMCVAALNFAKANVPHPGLGTERARDEHADEAEIRTRDL